MPEVYLGDISNVRITVACKVLPIRALYLVEYSIL